MPIAHLLAPLVAKKAREIDAGMSRAGYLQHDSALPIVIPSGGGMTEGQAYAQLDRERQADLAGLDVKSKAREAFNTVSGGPKRGTYGAAGATDADISERVARLAQMDEWTADNLRGLPDGAVDAARSLRSQRREAEAHGPAPGTLHMPGYLPKIGVEGRGRNKRATVHTYNPETAPLPNMLARPGGPDMTPREPALAEKLRKTAPTVDAYADEIARDLERKRMQLGYLSTAY